MEKVFDLKIRVIVAGLNDEIEFDYADVAGMFQHFMWEHAKQPSLAYNLKLTGYRVMHITKDEQIK